MAEATAAIHSASVRSSRHRLSAEMSALFAPERHGAPVQASPSRWTARAEIRVTATCGRPMSNPSQPSP